MQNPHQRLLLPYTAAAATVLAIGIWLSISQNGTWWLLGLAALCWAQTTLLRREIRTSGRLLRLFNAVSWTLLGFALVSLLPPVSARIIGDLVVLLIIAATFVGPRLRRAR